MLVLSRRRGERIHIGDGFIVTLVAIDGARVRLGIEAPAEILILREEARDRKKIERSSAKLAPAARD